MVYTLATWEPLQLPRVNLLELPTNKKISLGGVTTISFVNILQKELAKVYLVKIERNTKKMYSIQLLVLLVYLVHVPGSVDQ